MNRQIKFRAWDKKSKRWAIGKELLEVVPVSATLIKTPNIITIGKEGSDWIFQQYTGLKDKNGKEIYEGDIVKVVTKDFDYPDVVNKGKVIFEKGHWLIMGNEEYYLYGQDEIEIIGNIYENPELLK